MEDGGDVAEGVGPSRVDGGLVPQTGTFLREVLGRGVRQRDRKVGETYTPLGPSVGSKTFPEYTNLSEVKYLG